MAHAGTAHRYSEKLIAFEHAGAHSEKEKEGEKDTLLWIGGLGDGLLTVQYGISLFAFFLTSCLSGRSSLFIFSLSPIPVYSFPALSQYYRYSTTPLPQMRPR